MDLSRSETQELVKGGIHQLLNREMSWERVRETQTGTAGDESLWKTLAAAGWLSLAFPESTGGDGAELLDIAVAVEEIAASAAVVPFVETMATTYAVAHWGDPATSERLAAEVQGAAAGVTPALGWTGDRVTVAEGGCLSGRKRYVDYGQACAYHLVSATDGSQTALYLVDVTAEGVSQEPLRTIGHTPQANVAYVGVPGELAGGPAALEGLIQVATVLTCVQLLAYAQVALDMAVGYVRERVQFGRPIGTFQAVQHRCADMATMVEATRYLTYETVWKVQSGGATANDIAVAKAAASRTAVFATMESHQLHGGIGMTEEYPLPYFSRRAKDRSLAWCSQNEALLEIARGVDRDEDWR